jgi:hypothetical protein
MDKTNVPHTAHKKPNVITGPETRNHSGPHKKSHHGDEEDTSGPIQAPITAKKR